MSDDQQDTNTSPEAEKLLTAQIDARETRIVSDFQKQNTCPEQAWGLF
jgi:hypothetical protein